MIIDLFKEASEIYDSVSIILIESINQPRAKRRHKSRFGNKFIDKVFLLVRSQRGWETLYDLKRPELCR